MPGINPKPKGGAPSPAFFLALACKCPHCGRGSLYQGLLKVPESCSHCRFPLSRIDSGDGAAAFVILILGATLVPLALWVEFHFMPPLWLHVVLWLPLVTAIAIFTIRPVKAWLIHQQYRHEDRGGM